MRIAWSKNFNLGIDVIDAQHMRIMGYINDLDDAIQMPELFKKERVIRVLGDLTDYTESHFSFEEAMLEDAGFPSLMTHKQLHKLFIQRLNSYIERFKTGEDITGELRGTLARWLLNHIKVQDGSYVKYIKAPPRPEPRDPATASLWKRLFSRNK